MNKDISTSEMWLERIAKLLALNLLSGKTLKEQAVMLSDIGFSPKEIAKLLNRDSHVVRQTLYMARKEARKEESESTNSSGGREESTE